MRRTRLSTLLAILLAAPFVLAACGGDGGDSDEDKITEVIESSVKSGDPADCTELQTQAFTEQTTFETGEAAVTSCEEDATDSSDDPESVEVANVSVDGDTATAEVTFTGGGYDGSTLAVSLLNEDDGWKLDSIDDIPVFNVEGMKAALNEQAEADDELTSKQKSCILSAITGADEATLKSVALGDIDALEGLFEPCG